MTVRDVLDALQISYRPPLSATPKYFMVSCINPGHHDEHPSMRVDAEFGHFHCYGCGFRGPLARLLSLFPGASLDVDDIEFSRALRQPLESGDDGTDFLPPRIVLKGGLVPVAEVPEAQTYLESRGIGEDFIDYFELKAARMAFINGTRFWNRICLPVFYRGGLVSVEGRDWTRQQERKCIYPKGGMNSHLFHYDSLDLSKPVVLVEGIMDFSSIFPLTRNLVASFGSELTGLQRRQLSSIPDLIMMPDNDDAGEKMMRIVDDCMPEDREFRVAQPPAHRHDPGDCSVAEIEQALGDALPYSRWVLRREDPFPPAREWPAELLSGGPL